MSDEYDAPQAFYPVAAKPRITTNDPTFELPPLTQRAERLPPDEIERITTNRRKNLKNRPKQRRGKRKVAPAPKPQAPLSPNRPLEMKNRLHTVLGAVMQMSKAESIAFAGAMSQLEDMSKGARKRVIAALAQVYG